MDYDAYRTMDRGTDIIGFIYCKQWNIDNIYVKSNKWVYNGMRSRMDKIGRNRKILANAYREMYQNMSAFHLAKLLFLHLFI